MPIPWGMMGPDRAQLNAPVVLEAKNCIPGVSTFLPLPAPVSSTPALPSAVRGAVSVLKDDGAVATFAGTQTKLYKLDTDLTWLDVSRVSGGDYNVGLGEQWKFDIYGTNLLACNVNAAMQSIDVTSGTNFAAVSGAPSARYLAIMREFVLVGAILNNEKRVQWSANGNSADWTPRSSGGTTDADYQDLPNGGPVRGLIGGEVAYVFQAAKVTRMTFVPGSSFIMQFDEVEGASGLAAPHSLVRLRQDAYFLANDGFRKIALGSVSSTPIGVGKWAKWFLNDIKVGTELTVLGAANPVKPHIVWCYANKSTSSTTPNRMLIYDWSLDEATFADITVESLVKWLSPGITLDGMPAAGYSDLDTLPFSLDSPFWKGGASVLGVFGSDHTLSLLSGTPMQAQFVTGDGAGNSRLFVRGTRPKCDASGITVAVSSRERQADAVVWNTDEAMEDTGDVPAHASGNVFRARVTIPAQTWTQIEGIETDAAQRGKR